MKSNKSYWFFKREITRRDLIVFGLACAVPLLGLIALIIFIITKPTTKSKGGPKWILT